VTCIKMLGPAEVLYTNATIPSASRNDGEIPKYQATRQQKTKVGVFGLELNPSGLKHVP
jgi:hypothetical protein